MVQRFSCLALISVSLLVLTGLYQSWIHVGGLTVLVTTSYGRTLLLKLLLFSVMLSFGALNFFSTKRLLTRAAMENETDASVGRIALRRIGIESVIALLIFCATGFLTVLPPGIHAVHQQPSATPQPIAELTTRPRNLTYRLRVPA
jgi:copper transport protein